MEHIFETCRCINDLLSTNQEKEARNELIKLLDYHESNEILYSPLVNHLIREIGLYPYLQTESSSWQDKFIYEAFKVDTGDSNLKTLHREQSILLKKLLAGQNIAVSAPTSFGKSFVIDAFISMKDPQNVVIIVPTIALTDETRRRLYKKFAHKYKIITTPEATLAERNILIFPQERAISYIETLKNIDILIIDEFYKAGIEFDKERAPILLKAILELGKNAKQKYFLAPNISAIEESPFTEGMEFIPLDFNTVFSEIHESFKENDASTHGFKERKLLELLSAKKTKTLIYAGTYTNIDTITTLLNEKLDETESSLLTSFSDWLRQNYEPNYILADIARKGIGIHNGRLHRSLSQIQVKLFEEENGLDNIISTSSIIEGVNTSAENVVIWANKNGKPRLNDFTYKNIAGRGGRMFKHFIGKVYLFESPPKEESTQLKLEFSDDSLNLLDSEKFSDELTREQIIKIIAFNDEMDELLGEGVYRSIINDNAFQTFNSNTLRAIAMKMRENPNQWQNLKFLNSDNPEEWDYNLYLIMGAVGGYWGAYQRDVVAFIKAISKNWDQPISRIIALLRSNGITIEKFFELERTVTFRLASILNDINTLQSRIFDNSVDITPFIFKASHAFLPRLVYELEEYGLPRMVSKKIVNYKILDLENPELSIHEIINQFNRIGKNKLLESITDLHPFERYIIDYFYDGISVVGSAPLR